MLMANPDARTALGLPQYWLWRAADEFARQLEVWPTRLGSSLGESEHPVNPADLGPPQRNLGA
jgi:hypothetical protein